MASSSILIYGHDALLLDTRRWVLEKAGFRVSTASELPAVMKAMTVQAPLLVVLCHTLTAAERRAAISISAVYDPVVKTLAICTKRYNSGEDGISGETLSSLAGAQGLIAAAQRALA